MKRIMLVVAVLVGMLSPLAAYPQDPRETASYAEMRAYLGELFVELDRRVEAQRALAERWKKLGLDGEFAVTPNIGHWSRRISASSWIGQSSGSSPRSRPPRSAEVSHCHGQTRGFAVGRTSCPAC